MSMKHLVYLIGLCLLAGCATFNPERETAMITHSVFFKLNHEKGSDAETAFLDKARELACIPGVVNFQVLEETSPKNSFDFGLSMEFADQAAYEAYNHHPDHIAFVQNSWLKEVAEFQEIDHVPYEQ